MNKSEAEYNSCEIVQFEPYLLAMWRIDRKINWEQIDCIVAIKRSGLIMGAYLSNKRHIPLFVPSEINSIPEKYDNVLIVDDKIYSGKTMNKVQNKLVELKKVTWTACLYVQKDVVPNYWVEKTNGKITPMWYELH
jgi:adenine/guanine phosphoribosyltransferase-like PRPP-binding protein